MSNQNEVYDEFKEKLSRRNPGLKDLIYEKRKIPTDLKNVYDEIRAFLQFSLMNIHTDFYIVLHEDNAIDLSIRIFQTLCTNDNQDLKSISVIALSEHDMLKSVLDIVKNDRESSVKLCIDLVSYNLIHFLQLANDKIKQDLIELSTGNDDVIARLNRNCNINSIFHLIMDIETQFMRLSTIDIARDIAKDLRDELILDNDGFIIYMTNLKFEVVPYFDVGINERTHRTVTRVTFLSTSKLEKNEENYNKCQIPASRLYYQKIERIDYDSKISVQLLKKANHRLASLITTDYERQQKLKEYLEDDDFESYPFGTDEFMTKLMEASRMSTHNDDQSKLDFHDVPEVTMVVKNQIKKVQKELPAARASKSLNEKKNKKNKESSCPMCTRGGSGRLCSKHSK